MCIYIYITLSSIYWIDIREIKIDYIELRYTCRQYTNILLRNNLTINLIIILLLQIMIQFTRLRLFRAANTRLWRKCNRSILFEFNLFTFDRIIILTWSISRTHGGAAVWITRDIGYDIRSNIHGKEALEISSRDRHTYPILLDASCSNLIACIIVSKAGEIDRSIDRSINYLIATLGDASIFFFSKLMKFKPQLSRR